MLNLRAAGIRLSAALLIGALALVGCKKTIVGGLTERQANEIIVELSTINVKADKAADTHSKEKFAAYTIAVEEEDAVAATRHLLAEQLPRPAKPGMKETFSTPSMIPTEIEEQSRFLTAREGDIEKMLEKHPRIVGASVHLVLPKENPLEAGKDITTARASVLVNYRPATIQEKSVDKLKEDAERYEGQLRSLATDMLQLRKFLTEDLVNVARQEKAPFTILSNFFQHEKTADQAIYVAARQAFRSVAKSNEEREAIQRRIEGLDKIKTLKETISMAAEVEDNLLPFTTSAIRSLVASSVPRLSPEDVTVEFVLVKRAERQEQKSPTAMPFWQQKNFVLGMAGAAVVLALALIGLVVYIMGLKTSLEKARKQAASATSAKLGGSIMQGSMVSPAPGAPPGGPPG